MAVEPSMSLNMSDGAVGRGVLLQVRLFRVDERDHRVELAPHFVQKR